MRLFIAIELEEKAIKELSKLQEDLKSSEAPVKWVKPKNLHLTLKFLGEQKEERIEKIKEVIQKLTKKYPKFEIIFQNLGAFPKINSPRVIWTGIKEENLLKKIAKNLEENLEKLNIPKEKRGFSGHITLGRLKSNLRKEKLIEKLKANLKVKEFSSSVSKITLFKSTLTPKGPIYEKIFESPLAN